MVKTYKVDLPSQQQLGTTYVRAIVLLAKPLQSYPVQAQALIRQYPAFLCLYGACK